jgi:hypothetical protein
MLLEPQTRPGGAAIASKTLVVALLVSLAVHGVLYELYGAIKSIHWSGYNRVRAMLTPKPGNFRPFLLDLFQKKNPSAPKKAALQPAREMTVVIERESPMSFLPVDPMQAAAEEPNNPKFYSDKNSLAANRDIKKESDQPNLDGKQTLIPFTMDVPRQNLKPEPIQAPQPRPPDKQAAEEKAPDTRLTDLPEPQPKEVAEEKPKPKGGDTVGDLALARPADRKFPSDGQADAGQGLGQNFVDRKTAEKAAKLSRPRTLIEARARMQENAIAGQKMQQEGGVKNRVEISALDAKATPCGAYDAAIVAAIQQRWYDLLDRCRYSGDKRGRVVLEFRLHANGRISNLTEAECTVGEFLSSLCQLAITDPAPYPKWPIEMQRLFGGDFRDVRFTFFYY